MYEGLGRTLVAEPGLHCLDTGSVADQQAGIEMPQVVESDLIREARGSPRV